MIHDPKFWLAISFIVFVILMIKYALPLILKSLDSKVIKITNLLKDAEDSKKKADQLLKDAEKYLEDSVKFGDQIVKDAAIESQKITEDYIVSVKKEIAKKLSVSEERIKSSEERIVREIKSKIVESAINAIANNIDDVADEKALDQATKNSINQIKSLS